jgi:hypothetical protein
MASSNVGMSEHNNSLFQKFQGNGWALTCSAKSQKEICAILGDKVSAEQQAAKPPQLKVPPLAKYESDWADTILERRFDWTPDESSAPLWLQKATEGSDLALFQLPAPDNRWVVKFAGQILEPFNNRLEGWPELHELMSHGHFLDRAELSARAIGVANLKRQPGDILRNAELFTAYGELKEASVADYSVTGARLKAPNDAANDGKPDRWKTCADDFNKQLRDRLDRVLNAIKRKYRLAASVIKQAIRFRDGQFIFSEAAQWMTTIGEIPYDATMVLSGKCWDITFPDSSEPLITPDGVAMRAIARLLMCDTVACPSALLSDGDLLNDFLSRPRHHKYFEAIHRRPKVQCGDPRNNEVERAICAAMRFKEGWPYVADHVISEKSELHTVCGLPTGRVTLRRADALEGIRNLLEQHRTKIFFVRPPSLEFQRILADIEAGIKFARKQENLLQQVQPKSEEFQAKVQKALYRLRSELPKMGDWTTRYDRLADHITEYIRGGTVFQYTGPYRWKIEGISRTPDTLDLAADHRAFKRRKVNRANREVKAKLEAIRVLNQLSRGAAS